MDPSAVRVSPEHALAIYAEALVARGVVAVIGDASARMGDLLLRLGARAVHVWDPDVARALAQADLAPRGVTVRPLAREDLGRRDFDLALVPDLGLFDDPESLLSEVRRMVGEDGVALVAAANGEVAPRTEARAFDYYELFDLVAREFDYVRMIAELPFRGVALAELSDDEDPASGVSVDTQLGDDGAPAMFVALASQRDVRLDPYAIVQLPSVASQETAEAAVIAEVAEGEVAARIEAEEAREALARALNEHGAAVADLQGTLEERTRQVGVLSAQLKETNAAAQAGRLAAAEELDELIARVDRAERRSVALETELAQADAHSPDHARLEEVLRERAQVVRGLEDELKRRDRLVRDLAGALEEATGAPVPAAPLRDREADEAVRLRARLDALALDLARREGEAQASAWTIAELERRLAMAERAVAPPPGDSGAGEKLAAALDELDALRRALVQENEARRRAESRLVGDSAPGPEDLEPSPQER
jgi:SAM-dependent methyltransferase